VELDAARTDVAGEWFALCHGLGVPLVEATGMATNLFAAYGEPHRHYHTLDHVQECLRLLVEVPLQDDQRRVAELAVWFHDAVYDPARGDNEAKSGAMASGWLAGLDLDHGEVVEIIAMTAGHSLPAAATPAMEAVHDVDLAVLGRPPDGYDDYSAAIRREYIHIADDLYRVGRQAALEALAMIEPLYVLPAFTRVLAAQARSNIARELEALA
jgi:predicted metal-dependent HD superfamily phosphohydrolase